MPIITVINHRPPIAAPKSPTNKPNLTKIS
jgi:hypothetical protein